MHRYCSLLIVGLLSLPQFAGAADIPPVPARDGVGDFIHDYAGLLDQTTMQRIGEAQKQAFEQHNTPIIVVTINRMADYRHSGSIESLAAEWFNAWQIGTQNREGGANRGVLILVSVGDRKARIELGGDWGRDWDAYCQRVMDHDMVPNFRQGDYARGIATAAESLVEMAAGGPSGKAPGISFGDRASGALRGTNRGMSKYSFFPTWAFWLAILAGIGLIVGGIMLPEHRKWMIITGVALIGVALFTMVAIFLLFAWGRLTGRISGGSGGSGGYSGGGFSGGSSGGGGASGSW